MVEMNNLAYLASEYPAISHTFIFREVQALRKQGYSVITASINDSKNVERMTPEEQRDKQDTFYIKSAGKTAVCKDHLGLFFSSPSRYFRLFRNAHKLMADSSAVWMKRTMYFVEAVLLLRWMKRNSATHLHVHFCQSRGIGCDDRRELWNFQLQHQPSRTGCFLRHSRERAGS